MNRLITGTYNVAQWGKDLDEAEDYNPNEALEICGKAIIDPSTHGKTVLAQAGVFQVPRSLITPELKVSRITAVGYQYCSEMHA